MPAPIIAAESLIGAAVVLQAVERPAGGPRASAASDVAVLRARAANQIGSNWFALRPIGAADATMATI